jgi:hypothetical protein
VPSAPDRPEEAAALQPTDNTTDPPATAAAAALPDIDPAATDPGPGQATVSVSLDVARRFRRYQNHLATKNQGRPPQNGDIVFAALNANLNRFGEIIAERQPKPQPGQLFGAPVPGRRSTSGASSSQQLSFRPTPVEKARLAALAKQHGVSMAKFIDAVLDDFLTSQRFPPAKGAEQS